MFVSRAANERQKSDINHWILAIERFIINLMSPKRIVARITDIIFPILKYCSEKGSNTYTVRKYNVWNTGNVYAVSPDVLHPI